MINKVTLLGRVARDPEVRNFPNGGMVANIRVLTTESWKDRQSGERQERTEGHNVSIFVEPTVRYVQNNLKKGDLVYVEGALATRKWQDQTGADRYSTEVTIRPYNGEIRIIPTGRKGGGEMAEPTAAQDEARDTSAARKSQDAPRAQQLDDEIPF